MAQITPGILLGQSVYIFRLPGAPAASTNELVASAAVGSQYLQTDGGSGSTLWILEGPAPGTWVAK